MPFGQFAPGRESAAGTAYATQGIPIDLQHVTAREMAVCSSGLEKSVQGATSREDAAGRMVQHLFESFRNRESGEPSCALVRCFQTCPLATLPKNRRAFAMKRLGAVPYRQEMRCLTLLATRGVEPQWNHVEDSAEHQAIPLPSVDVILRAPMIARLILQMGIRYEHVVAPPEGDDFMVSAANETLKVFHVARARGSQYIPAQASFVHRYGIRSVLGLGGLSPSGELCAIVMFTRVPVSREIAEEFRVLAAPARAALVHFPPEQTFANPN